MSKYTKGPWEMKVEEQRIRIGGELIKEHYGKNLKYPRQRVIGETFGIDEEGLANARLISAAPELLEACKQVLPILIQYTPNKVGTLKQLKQAIAKAEE